MSDEYGGKPRTRLTKHSGWHAKVPNPSRVQEVHGASEVVSKPASQRTQRISTGAKSLWITLVSLPCGALGIYLMYGSHENVSYNFLGLFLTVGAIAGDLLAIIAGFRAFYKESGGFKGVIAVLLSLLVAAIFFFPRSRFLHCGVTPIPHKRTGDFPFRPSASLVQ